ncbi:MAG: hypothetical protein AB7L09_03380 [Nitrospira sp.]
MNCHVQVKTLTVVTGDGDLSVTVALPVDGISATTANLLVACVHLFSWALRWLFWVTGVLLILVRRQSRW